MLGYSREELIGREVGVDIPNEVRDSIMEAIRQGRETHTEHPLMRKDGQGIVVETHGRTVDYQNRKVRLTAIRDITERKQAEAVQAFLAQTGGGTEGEPFFDALARYLAQSLGMDFICIDRLEGDGLTASTLSVWCDGQFEDNVTYALKDTPCGEVVGNVVCCFPASVCQFFPRDQVLQELRAESYVGVTLWGHTAKPIGLIAVIGRSPLANRALAETTLKLVAGRAAGELERLDAEEALRGSEERLKKSHEELEHRIQERTQTLQRTVKALCQSQQQLAEAQRIAHLVNWDWNIATGELDWSDEMYRMFGFEPQAFPANYGHFTGRVHPDDRGQVAEVVKRALEGKEEYNVQYRILMPDGEVRAVKALGEVTFDEKGNPVRMFGTALDVTEQLRAQEEATLRQQQLIQADKLASLGVVAAGVAHEINNPNHSIMSNVTALSEVWESTRPILDRFYADFGDFVLGGFEYSECHDKLPGMFSNALANSRRIEVIVNELRDFARSSPRELTAGVDVNAAVNSALILVSSLVKKHTDRFSTELAAGLPPVSGNFQRIEQVIINLVQNACQALPSRDRAVTVVTHHDASTDSVVITVCDEGTGISEQNMKHMGTPFFTTKRHSEGTGLGLWISMSIVREHGGTLTFNSNEGRGTCAVLSLPASGQHTPKEVMDSAEECKN